MVLVELERIALGPKHRQCASKSMKKRHHCSHSLSSPGSFYKKCLEASERPMILTATGNRYQLERVERAMKIQFTDDEIRNHDDRTWQVP